MRAPRLAAAVREVEWRGGDGVVVALPEHLLPRRGRRRDGLGGGGDGGRHEALGDTAGGGENATTGADLVRPRARGPGPGRVPLPRVVLLLRAPGARRDAAAVLANGGTPLRRICEVNHARKSVRSRRRMIEGKRE